MRTPCHRSFIAIVCLWLFHLPLLIDSTMSQKNIYGEPLQPCSTSPMTGWHRDGYCRTDRQDHGVHTVCATMTKEFLEYTKAQGNDLSTPNHYFPGLKPGDSWCLCAGRWEEARQAGAAPKVKLEATHEVSLRAGLTTQILQEHAIASTEQQTDSKETPSSIELNGHCSSDSELCDR